jgi:hypothetical protein
MSVFMITGVPLKRHPLKSASSEPSLRASAQAHGQARKRAHGGADLEGVGGRHCWVSGVCWRDYPRNSAASAKP